MLIYQARCSESFPALMTVGQQYCAPFVRRYSGGLKDQVKAKASALNLKRVGSGLGGSGELAGGARRQQIL